MSGPSLEYYKSIFRNRPEKITSVKDLLLKDFRSFESKFQEGLINNDFTLIKKELHKMRPIVSNLRYLEMMEILDKYEKLDSPAAESDLLNKEIEKCLLRIFHFLESQ